MSEPQIDAKIEARFWAKVNRSGPTMPGMASCCWTWMASTDGRYGQMRIGGRPGRLHQSHRLSWWIAGFHIPDGLLVLHRCDNPPCVNPDHLFLGTQKDNLQDASAKRRCAAHVHPECLARGDRSGSRLHPERLSRGARHSELVRAKTPRGENNPAASLTNAEVQAIRDRFASGERQIDLSRAFGCTPQNIHLIVRGKSRLPLKA